MKPLKPSHREKKRYLLIKGQDASRDVIEGVILEFVGVLGFAEALPQFIVNEKGKVVMAVNRSSLDKIRSAFVMSEKDLQIVKVSGGVGKIKNAFQ